MEIAARSIRNGYRIIMHRRRAVRRVLQQMMARIFPGGDIDARRRGRGPDGGQRVEVAVAPFLGLARGKGESVPFPPPFASRSDERRVGHECVITCRSRLLSYP